MFVNFTKKQTKEFYQAVYQMQNSQNKVIKDNSYLGDRDDNKEIEIDSVGK